MSERQRFYWHRVWLEYCWHRRNGFTRRAAWTVARSMAYAY